MPVDKVDVQNLVRLEAVDDVEKGALLHLASRPDLWEGLEEDEVMSVLRNELAKTGSGRALLARQVLQNRHSKIVAKYCSEDYLSLSIVTQLSLLNIISIFMADCLRVLLRYTKSCQSVHLMNVSC